VEVVKGKQGRWLVDYWMPKRFHGPPAVAPSTKAKADAKKLRERHAVKTKSHTKAKPSQAREPVADAPRIRGAWWALPLGLLALAILLPLTIGGFIWYRNRKAERAYFRSNP
jgi:hypothetical protein